MLENNKLRAKNLQGTYGGSQSNSISVCRFMSNVHQPVYYLFIVSDTAK